MVWEKKPVIFDLGQAVLNAHPLADTLLQHDVETINLYFSRVGVEIYDNQALKEWIKTGKEELH